MESVSQYLLYMSLRIDYSFPALYSSWQALKTTEHHELSLSDFFNLHPNFTLTLRLKMISCTVSALKMRVISWEVFHKLSWWNCIFLLACWKACLPLHILVLCSFVWNEFHLRLSLVRDQSEWGGDECAINYRQSTGTLNGIAQAASTWEKSSTSSILLFSCPNTHFCSRKFTLLPEEEEILNYLSSTRAEHQNVHRCVIIDESSSTSFTAYCDVLNASFTHVRTNIKCQVVAFMWTTG